MATWLPSPFSTRILRGCGLASALLGGLLTAHPALAQGVDAAQTASKPMFEPVNRTQFFLQPNQAETLKWRVQGEPGNIVCEVRDFQGNLVLTKPVPVQNGEMALPLQLAPGFYEVTIAPAGQQYGLVVAAPYQGAMDKFFGIDAALSWLETRPAMRADLVALLKRSGIGLARERMTWGAVNPQPNTWDWETPRQFETLRQEYARQGVQILELFHSAPNWTKANSSSPYPQNMSGTKQSWQAIAGRWQQNWNALEVWNEPDIEFGGELPPDQYLPTVKTINYALHEKQSPALVGGGVFAYFTPSYIQGAVKNGLLDQVDFVSFHTYAKAPALEQIVGDYRKALGANGQPVVPLWLTESGQPWKTGPARPGMAEDSTSALDIAMKAVEARACGVGSYFAFVYPYYVEGARNFGMMGQEVSPLRSMAAYVQTVSALSHTSYIGDLPLTGAAVQRARVFTRGDKAIVVLYAENAKAETAVPWTGAVDRVQGMDGRELRRLANGAIPLSDGLTYVEVPLQGVAGAVQRQTIAAQLNEVAKKARVKRPSPAAVVLQPVLPATVQSTKRGYKVGTDAEALFPFRVRLNNLAAEAKQVNLQCTVGGVTNLMEQKVELAPQESREVLWEVDLGRLLRQADTEFLPISVTGQETGGVALSPLSVDLFCERDLETYLRLYPASTKLDFTDLTRWRSNITPVGEMKLAVTPEGNWQMRASFKPGDRWVYPDLQVQDTRALIGSEGLILRARALAPATVRLMVKERGGATYFTPFSIVPPDGQWHSVSLPWRDLAALPSAPPDPNGQLDLEQVVSISLGMNSKADENTLEMSHLYLARKTNTAVASTLVQPSTLTGR